MTNADGSPANQPAPVSPAEPRYGEYSTAATPAPAYQAYPGQMDPSYYAQVAPPRKSHTADVVVTCILLAFGLIGAGIGALIAAVLDASLRQESAKYGVAYEAPASLGGVQIVIVVSHVILYLVALGVSIPLMIKRRIAFWVPLVAGVIAALIFWIALIVLITGDTSLFQAIQAANGR